MNRPLILAFLINAALWAVIVYSIVVAYDAMQAEQPPQARPSACA